MLEIMQFYVSSFWVWLGLTMGLWVIVVGGVMLLTAARKWRGEVMVPLLPWVIVVLNAFAAGFGICALVLG